MCLLHFVKIFQLELPAQSRLDLQGECLVRQKLA
jgi:hypothetical protein